MDDLHPHRVRFGDHELDLESGELCLIGPAGRKNNGNKVLLREQVFQVLRMLVEGGGKIVTRDEMKKRLWPNDTVVDFDHSINAAIKTLRRALGDSADNPQYIETLARRGYRLRVAIEWLETKEPARDKITPPRSFPGFASLAGKKVSHYRVLEVIGGGGMGIVYKAEDLKLGRRVALKFLPEELAIDPVGLERFEHEARSASALNHPNICTIYEIDECDGQPFIAMELLEGETLLEHLNSSESKTLGLTALLNTATQVCDGLQAAHEKGIIHRDIKPANIFLTAQGAVKILDFGLAKLATKEQIGVGAGKTSDNFPADSRAVLAGMSETLREEFTGGLTRTGVAIGTARYMSPEQVRKEHLDARTDLFSLGLVLYEMATGRHAFEGDTEAALHDAILTQTQRSSRDLNSAVPRGLDAVITRALEKDRSQRYQSAANIRTDLERVRRAMNPMRRSVQRGLAYSVLLLIIATGAWLYWDYRTRVTLSSSDTIVLADLSNHTVDPVLDGALNLALHTGLEQTPYLQILGPDKVFGTLVQLGQHYDVKVTPEIARQVCLKTNSKVVITSSITDAGNRFQIELDAVGCPSGVTMARVREAVGARENIVHELGVAAVSLRRKLGEPAASIQQFNQPLEVATSSSLEALQLLMEGYKQHIAREVRGASTLYQRAIDLDPNFALAYSALGAAYTNVLGEESRMKMAEERAYALQGRMTVPDRFQAETGYYDLVTGELEKSSLIYARWLQLFPQNVFVRVNYAHCLRLLGREDQAARLARGAGRLLPNSMYVDLMGDYIVLDRLSEAKATFDEARSHRIDGVYLRDRRVLLAFLQKDNDTMQEQWSWAVGKPGADAVVYGKAMVETYYGKFRDGRSLIEQAIALPEKSQELNSSYYRASEAAREAEVGNLTEAQQIATKAFAGAQDRYTKFKLALAFALAGDLPQAQKLADALNQEFPLDTLAQNYSLPTIRAAMKLRSNDPARAIEILRPALRYELANAIAFNSVYPAYIRGCAYLKMGDGRSAAVEFQKLLDHPGLVGREVIGALSHLQLARAQNMSGDETAARRSYEEFLTLWKNADSNIPIYQQAKTEYAKLLSQRKTTEAPSGKSPA